MKEWLKYERENWKLFIGAMRQWLEYQSVVDHRKLAARVIALNLFYYPQKAIQVLPFVFDFVMGMTRWCIMLLFVLVNFLLVMPVMLALGKLPTIMAINTQEIPTESMETEIDLDELERKIKQYIEELNNK